MEKKDNLGVWIPEYLYEIEKLKLNDIVIYSIIISFGNSENGCFATNGYFAKRIAKNEDTARRSITKLFDLGHITWEENFNYKSNRVLRVANKVPTYLKTPETVLKNDRVPLVKISNNNKTNNININSTTSTAKEKLESNLYLINSCCEEYKKEKEYVLNFINEFVKSNKELQKVWENDNDLFKHFKSTLVIKIKKENQKPKRAPKQNLKEDEDFETNLKWFIDMFNNLSKKVFNITPVLRVRFKQQLANGFTGDQMKKAVNNLYSSSMDNKFHKESRFKFATPEYLLKDDNLNKYSNLNYENYRSKVKRIG